MAAGIAMIHQHFMLVEAMTVVENVMLGWPAAGRVLQRGGDGGAGARGEPALRPRPRPRCARSPRLPLGRRQRVEILKAILRDAELLILDEPTSNLAPTEVAELLTILRRLRAEGKGIVFITHKLPEVLEVCDEVVVLRDGRVSGRAPVAGASRAQLAEMMVGRDITAPHAPDPRPPGAVRLDGAAILPGRGLPPLTFDVRGGEILGVAGVDGNGQIELAETLAGLRRAQAGRIVLDGRDITHAPVAARVQRGPGLHAGRPRAHGAGARHVGRREPDAARQRPSALCPRPFLTRVRPRPRRGG